MRLTDFKIGEEFTTNAGTWICTDIGTRVITAMEKKEDWNAGPPYALAEVVFDEDSQQVCYKTYDEWYIEDYKNQKAFRTACLHTLDRAVKMTLSARK